MKYQLKDLLADQKRIYSITIWESSIPCYTYTLPDGRVLVFEGHPQEEKPDTDPGSMRYEFRIYMVNPEDSNDGRYILADNRD